MGAVVTLSIGDVACGEVGIEANVHELSLTCVKIICDYHGIASSISGLCFWCERAPQWCP